ncbi:L-lactate permease [Fodinicola feengrottensis]|uniref:L-lactate permease n=1 Tax=Fodinicola feengrottensis TaxID=435914 RepID=UPI0024415FE1|nr:L-lactate permease [Fodinicola feengrottensis]
MEAPVYTQNLNPTGSLTLSALLASLPLLALLIALGVFKWRAHWAGTAALLISLVVAIAVYHMPIGQTLNAGVFGAALSILARSVDHLQRDLDLQLDRTNRAFRGAAAGFRGYQ